MADQELVTCSVCGASTEAPAITWTYEHDPRRGAVWVCTRCTRRNTRAIEGRLDREWW